MHLLRKSKIFERMSVPDGPVLRIVDLMKDTNLQREICHKEIHKIPKMKKKYILILAGMHTSYNVNYCIIMRQLYIIRKRPGKYLTAIKLEYIVSITLFCVIYNSAFSNYIYLNLTWIFKFIFTLLRNIPGK